MMPTTLMPTIRTRVVWTTRTNRRRAGARKRYGEGTWRLARRAGLARMERTGRSDAFARSIAVLKIYLLIGPLEKAKLTSRVWSSMLDPFAPSIAAWASFFVSYSISAYPLTNPVRRSRLRCMFRISP